MSSPVVLGDQYRGEGWSAAFRKLMTWASHARSGTAPSLLMQASVLQGAVYPVIEPGSWVMERKMFLTIEQPQALDKPQALNKPQALDNLSCPEFRSRLESHSRISVQKPGGRVTEACDGA